jgi:Fe-S-cluster containining protein
MPSHNDEIFHSLAASTQRVVTEMTALFESIDNQTKVFAQQTGLKCKHGCGACCANPDIEITVADALPLAVYLWSRGQGESILDVIRSPLSNSVCIFYKPDLQVQGQGSCSIYPYRPGICRLFGFASRNDKHGQRELLTCKIIKDSHAKACQSAQEKLQKGQCEAPLLTNHALTVASIDPVHGHKLLPINQAIGLALEKIGYRVQNSKQ